MDHKQSLSQTCKCHLKYFQLTQVEQGRRLHKKGEPKITNFFPRKDPRVPRKPFSSSQSVIHIRRKQH